MKPNFIGVLPNFRAAEYRLASALLTKNFSLQEERLQLDLFVRKLKGRFGENTEEVLLLDSARSAFDFLLKQLALPEKSEVIITAFTCVVIVNPILWNGLKPVFIDINPQNFNNDVEQIIAKVTKGTKVIMVQHSFGALFPVKELQLALKNINRSDILVVEDLAHVMGIKNEGEEVGTQGDFGVVSFGVEKTISTIRGGALLINNTFIKRKDLAAEQLGRLVKEYENLKSMEGKWENKLLMNAVFWRFTLPLYYIGIGKLTIGRFATFLGHKLGILGIAISPNEYAGGKPKRDPQRLSGKLASLGILQLDQLDEMNQRRAQIARKYTQAIKSWQSANSLGLSAEQQFAQEIVTKHKNHGWLRYPVLLPKLPEGKLRAKLLAKFRKERIVLGDWYRTMFYTKPEFLANLGYKEGSCKITEDVCGRIINLPTHINTTDEQVERILNLLKTELEK